MLDETEIREALERLGLAEVCRNGEFHGGTIESLGDDYSAPIIHVENLAFFGAIERYKSSRKLVFPYSEAVLKTGESGLAGISLSEKEHERPDEKQWRKERAFTEFNRSTRNADNGLPVVKPVCIIHTIEEDEYLLVEPKGRDLKMHMYFLLSDCSNRQRELELTVEALGAFFRSLREHNATYEPNITFRNFVFEHMLRFGSQGGYRILLTDDPSFREGYSPYGIHREVLRQLKGVTSGNEGLRTIINREYRKGYVPSHRE